MKTREMTLDIGERRTTIDVGKEKMNPYNKIDSLTFDDIIEPNIFSDWMLDLDYNFGWYRFTGERRVRFARMRLSGSVRIY